MSNSKENGKSNSTSNDNTTSKDNFIVAFEYIYPIVIVVTWVYLTNNNVIPREVSIIWFLGFMLGLIWESLFKIIGDKFMITKNEKLKNSMPPFLYSISHALQDSVLFIIGFIIAYFLLGQNLKAFCSFNVVVLIVFVVWGLLQEIYIEYLYNDKLWEYLPGKYNPTIVTTGEGKNKKNWTLIPYITWLIAPIIYWIIVTKVFQRSGRCTI